MLILEAYMNEAKDAFVGKVQREFFLWWFFSRESCKLTKIDNK